MSTPIQHIYPQVNVNTPGVNQLTPNIPIVETANVGGSNEQLQALSQQFKDFTLHLGTQIQSVCQEIPKLVQAEVNKLKSNEAKAPEARVSAPAKEFKTEHVPTFNHQRYKGHLRPRDLSTFDGDVDKLHPKEFIDELQLFFDLNPEDKEDVKLNLVGRLLKSRAHVWFMVYKDSFLSFSSFKAAFLEYFWDGETQDDLRESLYVGKYTAKEGSLTDYFLSKVHKAGQLNQPMPETILISTIMRQYPTHVPTPP